MKFFVRNLVISVIALDFVIRVHSELNVLKDPVLSSFPDVYSLISTPLRTFLYYSIPEILVGVAMVQLLSGPFKIYWCMSLAFIIFFWFQPVRIVEIGHMSLIGKFIMYAVQYSHPIFIVIPTLIVLKWPNQTFKRDYLR